MVMLKATERDTDTGNYNTKTKKEKIAKAASVKSNNMWKALGKTAPRPYL